MTARQSALSKRVESDEREQRLRLAEFIDDELRAFRESRSVARRRTAIRTLAALAIAAGFGRLPHIREIRAALARELKGRAP